MGFRTVVRENILRICKIGGGGEERKRIITSRFRVSHRRPGRKDIRSGRATLLSHTLEYKEGWSDGRVEKTA
jgi:hypothetical protein